MSNTSMEARIALETRDLKSAEVRELILDNCRSATLEGLTDQYEELEVLSMINVGLTTLKGFPSYPKLRSLELSDNKLTSDLEYLKGCPNLASLKLCNNRFSDTKGLEPLKLMKELRSLDLIECPISEKENYKDDVFGVVGQLTFLDGIDREGNAEPDSDEDYEFDEEEEIGLSDEDVDSEEEGEEDEGALEEEEDEDDVEDDVEDDQPASKRAKLEDAESAPDSNGVPDTAPEESVDGEESKS